MRQVIVANPNKTLSREGPRHRRFKSSKDGPKSGRHIQHGHSGQWRSLECAGGSSKTFESTKKKKFF